MPFQKGHPGYRLGTKNKKTLEKEELRQILHEKVAAKWDTITSELIEKEKKYVVDQVIGKAKDSIEVQGLDFLFPDEKTS